MRMRSLALFIALFSLIGVFLSNNIAYSQKRYKVLVVMSYENDFGWNAQIQEGIETVLKDSCDMKFVYLRTKQDFANGPRIAKEAFNLYQHWHPDGVIASDDDAQSMFVVPYLRDTVDTPIMFCGVNNTISNYGYPNHHISGIIEHLNMKETITFVKQLVPDFKSIVCMARKSPAVGMMFKQLQEEEQTYLARIVAYEQPDSLPEAIELAAKAAQLADVLFVGTMSGIADGNGNPVEEATSIPLITKAFGKPTVVDTKDRVPYGALCAVIQVGQEQGSVAAEMLLKAMSGTPVDKLPVTRNYYGMRIINVTAAKRLAIELPPMLLRGAELVSE